MVSAIVFAFTSCTSSEDIEINDIQKKYQVAFKINPATVVEPFTYEFESGELQTFDNNYELRVRLLLYGQDGKLIDEDTQFFPNYKVTMTSNKKLQEGSYIAVVISDLKKKTSSTETSFPNEYWSLSKDYSELTNLTIQDLNYVGAKNKILGISYERFNVNSGDANEIKINVKPAGAIIALRIDYPHILDIKQLQLGTNKIVEKYIFNVDGSYSVIEDIQNDYANQRLMVYDVDKYEGISCNHYFPGYYFVLPSKYNYKWLISNTEVDFKDLIELHDEPMTLNMKAGEEWFLGIDLKNRVYYEPENVSNRTNTRSISNETENNNVRVNF